MQTWAGTVRLATGSHHRLPVVWDVRSQDGAYCEGGSGANDNVSPRGVRPSQAVAYDGSFAITAGRTRGQFAKHWQEPYLVSWNAFVAEVRLQDGAEL